MAKDFTTREENYAQWYNDLVIKADLALPSAVGRVKSAEPSAGPILSVLIVLAIIYTPKL